MSISKAQALKKRVSNPKYCKGYEAIDWKKKKEKVKSDYEEDELSKILKTLK